MLGLSSPSLRWKTICFGAAALNLIGIIATQSRVKYEMSRNKGIMLCVEKLIKTVSNG